MRARCETRRTHPSRGPAYDTTTRPIRRHVAIGRLRPTRAFWHARVRGWETPPRRKSLTATAPSPAPHPHKLLVGRFVFRQQENRRVWAFAARHRARVAQRDRPPVLHHRWPVESATSPWEFLWPDEGGNPRTHGVEVRGGEEPS